jgi:ankyrin repeat protein
MFLKTIAGVICLGVILSAAAGDTRLADAAQQGDKDAVRALLTDKVDVNEAQGDGMTALHWAAFNDDLELAQMLLGSGANVKAETRLGAVTPLFMASKNGSARMIETLLNAGADASAPDAHGTTPLMFAAAAGRAEAVRVLLDHGADANAKESAHQQTALMFAAAYNRDAAIKLLLERGADAKAATKVIDPGCGSVFDLSGCVETDANGDAVDENGNPIPKEKEKLSGKGGEAKVSATENTPPAAPTAQNAEELKTQVAQLEALVDKLNARVEELEKHPERAKPKKVKGAKAAKKGVAETKKTEVAARKRKGPAVTGGMTALLFAARDGHMEAARALVEAGADVNDPGAGEKIPPLVMAIANGHYDLAKYLLDHGADATRASDAGLTPLYATIDMQWAPYAWLPQPIATQEKISYLDLMTALLDHGADPNARLKQRVWFRALPGDSSWVDPAGATPFWRAAQADDLAAMHLLIAHGAKPMTPTNKGVTPLMVAAGLGWAPNFSRNGSDSWMAAVKYCLDLGADVNAKDENGYTALHGIAFRGDNDMINFFVEKGAKVDVKTKKGDSIADMANGPFQHSIPHAETVALLEKLGSVNSHNCRSDQCVPNTIEDKKPVATESAASTKPAKPGPK